MLEGGHNLTTRDDPAQPLWLVLDASFLHRFAFGRWLRFLGQEEQVVGPFDYACAYKTNTTRAGRKQFQAQMGEGETRR